MLSMTWILFQIAVQNQKKVYQSEGLSSNTLFDVELQKDTILIRKEKFKILLF